MRLRPDLVEFLTEQDFLEEVLANNHRYKAEPSFSKEGVGSLTPASPEERAKEIERSEALIERLKKRQQESLQENQSRQKMDSLGAE